MLSIAERAQQLKEMKNMVSKVISPEVRRSLDKSKVTELPEKSPIQIQPQPSVMTTTNPVTNPPKVVSHGNLFEKISKQFSPPPKSPLKKSSALDNKVQELVQKNAESIIKDPMPGPSNFESSSKADLAAFILEKTKATEAFQEEFILDEEVTPKILPHIPEKFTRKRVTRESTLYFVKWQGLPKTANTWENL